MQGLDEENGLILNMLIKETFDEKVAFEQRFRGEDGVNDAYIQGIHKSRDSKVPVAFKE